MIGWSIFDRARIEANTGASAPAALQSDGGVELTITVFAIPAINGTGHQRGPACRSLPAKPKPDLAMLLAGNGERPWAASSDLPCASAEPIPNANWRGKSAAHRRGAGARDLPD